MKFIDFFAGIGGFRRGMELGGHECVGFCEWDKFATASYTSMHLITETQREFLKTLPLRKRQKEILKEEYRNGEWYANDIRTVKPDDIPKSDCWCFGAPCQDFSIAGKRAGLDGERSSLVREIFRIMEDGGEEAKPEWIIYENVKGMLSSNRGLDFLSIISKMGELGYDIQWQNINSKNHGVPQNRERVYVVGRIREKGRCEILPIGTSDKTVNGVQGQTANTITTRYGTANAVGTYIAENKQHAQVRQIIGGSQGNRVYDPSGLSCTLSSQGGGKGAKTGLYAVPVLTPERMKKRQNGRRFKENGEPMFTLTAQDRHGVVVQKPYGNDLIDKAIRRLTPKECFRLQGWTDDYFEKAEFVNSDNQLYKQAGNGVTVNVVREIAEKMRLENEN